MNDSKLHTTPIQPLTNRIPTNFDNSNANLLSQNSQITLPKDQDQADFQNILAKWDSLSPRDSPSDLDFSIDNKSTRINPRKAIQRPLNQKNDQNGLVIMRIAQESALAVTETKEQRVRRNWEKVREGYKKYKAELKMSNLLHDRDDHVMFGERPGDVPVKMARRSWKEFYIDPRNKWLLFWEAVFHVTIVFHIVVHTYRISFNSGLYNQDPLDIVVETMDFCYFLNVVIKFFVAVRKPDESLITKHTAIAKSFLTNGTLILDIFSIIPLDLIVDELGLFKLLRLVHLTRLSKSMNFVVHQILVFVKLDGLQALILSNFLGNLIAVTLQLLIIFHFCTCVWISLGYPQYPGERTWFINIPDFDYDFGSNELIGGNISVYLSSLFFASQTLTTIGYGSPTGYSNREYLFCMGMLFFGLLIFTYFYEKIKAIVLSLNEAERIENQEVIELDSWLNMIERNVVENLEVVNEILISSFKKVLHHKIDQDWQEMFVENEQYKHLDPRAKKEVLRIAFYSLKKRFNILFKALSDDFIHHILVLCESRIYLPQEVIISKGSHPPGLFLILEGSVILSTETIKSSFLRLSTDSFFGEMMLTTKKSSSFNYIAERTVSCLFIDEKIFTKVDAKFAEDINSLRALAFYRNRAFLKERHRYNRRQEHITRLRKIKTVGFDSIKERSHRDTSLPRSQNASTLIIGPNESPLLRVNIMRRQNTIDPKSETNYFSGGQGQETSMIKDDSVFSLTPSPAIFKGVRKGTAEFNDLFGLNLDGKPEEDEVSFSNINSPPNPKKSNEERKDEFEEEEEENSPQKENSSSSSSSSDSSSSSSESDEYSSDEEDELNDSDLFPIERDIPEGDEKKIDTESVLEFLEERMAFVEHRFDYVKNHLNSDLIFASGKSKLLTKKSFSKI